MYFLAHNAAVTCSVFAPKPNLILEQLQLQQLESTLPDSDTSQLSDSTLSDVRNQFSPNKVFLKQKNSLSLSEVYPTTF